MIKFINKSKLLVALLFVFGLSSCGDMFDLDINQDPNNPAETTPDLLLTQAQYISAIWHGGGLNDNLQGFMGLIASGDDWNLSQSAYNGFWNTMYSGPLKDLEGVIEVTSREGSESPHYLGIAQLMKAYIYSNMVDLFGDVPYTEALLGDAEGDLRTQTPNFDDDETIYNDLLGLIDEAIANLSGPTPVTVNGDLYYDGNAGRWIKFAKTLKLRMLLNISVKDASKKADIDALLGEGDLILSPSDDFKFQYGRQTSEPSYRHPWYDATYIGSGNGFTYVLHQLMVEMLEDRDPRWSFYFRRQTNTILDQDNPSERATTPCSQTPGCTYGYLVLSQPMIDRLYTNLNIPYSAEAQDFLAGVFGRDRADPAGIPQDGDLRTMPGVYPAGGSFDVPAASLPGSFRAGGGGFFPQLTAVMTHYLWIEAILRLGSAGDARQLFQDAMETHIDQVISFGASVDPNAPSTGSYTMPDGREVDADAYVQRWLDRYDNATNDDARLNVVMKQFWFSSWGSGLELYNAFRRTGFPNTIQEPILNPRDFPRRLPYPQNELTVNPNASSYQNVIYDKDPVFWDVN